MKLPVKVFLVDVSESLLSLSNCRSSRLEVFCKKGVLKNFTKFSGKQGLFFYKVVGLRRQASKFIKKETLAQVVFL